MALREVTITSGPIHFSHIAALIAAAVVFAAAGAWFFGVSRRDFMDLI